MTITLHVNFSNLKHIFFFIFFQIPKHNLYREDIITNIYHNNAEIMGIDRSMRPCNINDLCNCPGGFFVNIEGVNDPNGKCVSCNSFKTKQFPKSFHLNENEVFPLAVAIEWKYDTLSCDSSRIDIIKIVRR